MDYPEIQILVLSSFLSVECFVQYRGRMVEKCGPHPEFHNCGLYLEWNGKQKTCPENIEGGHCVVS